MYNGVVPRNRETCGIVQEVKLDYHVLVPPTALQLWKWCLIQRRLQTSKAPLRTPKGQEPGAFNRHFQKNEHLRRRPVQAEQSVCVFDWTWSRPSRHTPWEVRQKPGLWAISRDVKTVRKHPVVSGHFLNLGIGTYDYGPPKVFGAGRRRVGLGFRWYLSGVSVSRRRVLMSRRAPVIKGRLL